MIRSLSRTPNPAFSTSATSWRTWSTCAACRAVAVRSREASARRFATSSSATSRVSTSSSRAVPSTSASSGTSRSKNDWSKPLDQPLSSSFGPRLASQTVAQVEPELRPGIINDEAPPIDSLEESSEPEPSLLNPEMLLRSSFPSGPPSLSDLDIFEPRRFTIPNASSPESHRIIYAKIWSQTYETLSHAFTKPQMLHLAGPTGLGLDPLGDVQKMRERTKGRKYLGKTLGMMNKKELCVTVMALQWGMVDPAVVPGAVKGPKAIETIPLSDRTLFLLLSPNSTTFAQLSKQHSLRFSFNQDPTTSTLNLIVSGPKPSVAVAKETIASILDTCHQREFTLPTPAHTLAAEVYQTISRIAKVYLEPVEGQSDDVLCATTTDASALERAERLLSLAFLESQRQRSATVFVRSGEKATNELTPIGPTSTPTFPTNAASRFARLVDVTRSDEEPSEGTRIMSRQVFPSSASGEIISILDSLRSRFPTSTPRSDLHLSARFGHVVFPFYPSTSAVSPGPLDVDSPFPLTRTLLPATPRGLLSETGVLTPIKSTLSPTLEFPLFSDLTDRSPEEENDRLHEIAMVSPGIISSQFRRIRYAPIPSVTTKKHRSLEDRIEFSYSASEDRLRRTYLGSARTQVLIPNGHSDVEVVMGLKKELGSKEVGGFEKEQPPPKAPWTVEWDGRGWVLEEDREVRRTQVGELRMERWEDLVVDEGEEEAQGVEVEWPKRLEQEDWQSWLDRVLSRASE